MQLREVATDDGMGGKHRAESAIPAGIEHDCHASVNGMAVQAGMAYSTTRMRESTQVRSRGFFMAMIFSSEPLSVFRSLLFSGHAMGLNVMVWDCCLNIRARCGFPVVVIALLTHSLFHLPHARSSSLFPPTHPKRNISESSQPPQSSIAQANTLHSACAGSKR